MLAPHHQYGKGLAKTATPLIQAIKVGGAPKQRLENDHNTEPDQHLPAHVLFVANMLVPPQGHPTRHATLQVWDGPRNHGEPPNTIQARSRLSSGD